jgi:hypothetical protein
MTGPSSNAGIIDPADSITGAGAIGSNLEKGIGIWAKTTAMNVLFMFELYI